MTKIKKTKTHPLVFQKKKKKKKEKKLKSYKKEKEERPILVS